ncbi:MAG: phage tail tape measure protein, partial [Candidatus Riflebacteria bacterium]|nr:phage tail tape measure protein [Candidatus Riflebacteria bacterium]
YEEGSNKITKNDATFKMASQIATAEENMRHYNEEAKKAEEQMGHFKQPAMVASAAFSTVGDTVNMMLKRFGRQMFYKAINEAKRFVQEFDKTMTTIQMITLKTDDQMSSLGDGLISKAKDLKISIKEISTSAATLYRQGLSDEEVSERLDVISKFSKVSGTKVDDATKLVTVAMNTGLVTDAQQAADIVTALGDNAATNAQQIEKGIEKAGAAAAADGTTFAELAAMLTAITSTTQIGGNVAGRTLNTIFGRMNKIGTNELIYDENGNAVSGSAVAKLLKRQGIETYDKQGNKRSSYDVLYDLSQKWESISDAEQQQLATAIAGTRQYSNFAAIMQGMAEGKVDEYMKLAGESEGITNKKFDIYTESLEASITNVKNSFDELVQTLTDDGTLAGFLDFISNAINGVNNLAETFGGLGAILHTVLPLLAGYITAQVGITLMKTPATMKAGLITAGVGLAMMTGGVATASIAGGIGKGETATEKVEKVYSDYNESAKTIDKDMETLSTLRKNKNRTEEEDKQYASLINDYAVRFDLIGSKTPGALSSIESLSSAISELATDADNAADAILKQSQAEKDAEWEKLLSEYRSSLVTAISDEKIQQEKSTLGTWDDENLAVVFSNGMYRGQTGLNKMQTVVSKQLLRDSAIGKAISGADSLLDIGMSDLFHDSYKESLGAILPIIFADSSGNLDQNYWSERIKKGQITEEEYETAKKWYETHSGEYQTSDQDRTKEAYKLIFSKLLPGRSEEDIDYLGGIASLYDDFTEGFNSVFINGSKKEIDDHIDYLLASKNDKTSIFSASQTLGLESNSGYYKLDGKTYSAEEIN